MISDLAQFFSDSGPLAGLIPGYRLRPQQVEMAQAVEQAIENRAVLIAEAGTGTGKTFAYLAPALSKGGKVIISTGTKTLQDQLFSRDIPMVRNALQAPGHGGAAERAARTTSATTTWNAPRTTAAS